MSSAMIASSTQQTAGVDVKPPSQIATTGVTGGKTGYFARYFDVRVLK